MTKSILEYIEQAELESTSNTIEAGDDFVLVLAPGVALETYVLESWNDGVLLASDAETLKFLESRGCKLAEHEIRLNEEIGYDQISPKSASYILRKLDQGISISDILDDFPELGRMMDIIAGEHGLHGDDDFEEIEDILRNDLEDIAAEEDDFGDDQEEDEEDEEDMREAEYQGRKVALGKPMAGDVKKSKVYVRKPNGKVVKVNFGDKKLSIKKHIPGRRKSFRARHNCANPGPRWKARYWSCRAW